MYVEPVSELPVPRISPRKGPACRILLVDDNEDGVEMLRGCLEDLGHEVRMAFDGHEALELAGGFLPSLVFLDVGLPGLDGYEVAQAMRKLPGWETIPIVAVTGYARESDRARAAAAGFSSHMAKPIDVMRLGAIVDELVGYDATAS
jgi:CheY-like chemotaxis protein